MSKTKDVVMRKVFDSFTIDVAESKYIRIYTPRQLPRLDKSEGGKPVWELSFPIDLVPEKIRSHQLFLGNDRPLVRAISWDKVPVVAHHTELKYMVEFAEVHNIEMDIILSMCSIRVRVTPLVRELAMMGRSLGLYLDAIEIVTFPPTDAVLSNVFAKRAERNEFRVPVA